MNKRKYDEFLCILSKINETVKKETYTNLLIWCQQNTKAIWKCNTESFGPVWQLFFVTLKCMRDSKPQCCVQQHKSLKVTRHGTNRDKNINEALKQIFANNLFKIPRNIREICVPIARVVSMIWLNESLTWFWAKLMKVFGERPVLT